MGKLKQAALSGDICMVCMRKINPPAEGPTLCDQCIAEDAARNAASDEAR